MSGGHFDYKNTSLAYEIFGWDMSPTYGEDGFAQSKKAAQRNPLEDIELSELVWDVLCLIYSYDYYYSGDNCEETYRADVERFKKKWFGRTQKNRVKQAIDIELERVQKNMYQAFGLESAND